MKKLLEINIDVTPRFKVSVLLDEGKICEHIVPELKHLFKSILYAYLRIKELGFTYFDGEVALIFE